MTQIMTITTPDKISDRVAQPTANNSEQFQPDLTENWGDTHSEETLSETSRDSKLPTPYAIGKIEYKPVGGSGWLNKYTSWKPTKYGLVEYPRIKEGSRSANVPEHWYWRYCWYKQSQEKPVYKNGKAVVKSIGCPWPKVGAVKQAIASRLPHRQILELIKGEDSTPPPT